MRICHQPCTAGCDSRGHKNNDSSYSRRSSRRTSQVPCSPHSMPHQYRPAAELWQRLFLSGHPPQPCPPGQRKCTRPSTLKLRQASRRLLTMVASSSQQRCPRMAPAPQGGASASSRNSCVLLNAASALPGLLLQSKPLSSHHCSQSSTLPTPTPMPTRLCHGLSCPRCRTRHRRRRATFSRWPTGPCLKIATPLQTRCTHASAVETFPNTDSSRAATSCTRRACLVRATG